NDAAVNNVPGRIPQPRPPPSQPSPASGGRSYSFFLPPEERFLPARGPLTKSLRVLLPSLPFGPLLGGSDAFPGHTSRAPFGPAFPGLICTSLAMPDARLPGIA